MIDATDFELIASVQSGLPLVARPYEVIGQQLAISEEEVILRLRRLKSLGLIRRWGVVVKHRQLGYQANAMIVMDVPDHHVAAVGEKLSRQNCVNLCYLRPRQDGWPYNLYCMIHGKSRETVLSQWRALQADCGLNELPYEVLFSKHCFKQRGALYRRRETNQESKFRPALRDQKAGPVYG